MKIKMLFSTLLVFSAATSLHAQYFDPHTDLITGKSPTNNITIPLKEGYSLDLGRGNKLFIPRVNSYPGSKSGLKGLLPTAQLIEAVKATYARFKDSLQDPLTVKKIQYLDFNGKIKTLVSQKPATEEKLYYTADGQTSMVKPQMDSITIARVDSTANYYRPAVIIFTLNSISDFSKVANSALIDQFIDSIEAAIPAKVASHAPWKYFMYGNYTLNNQNSFSGNLNSTLNVQRTFTIGFSADIQNIKNHFVPSASIGISMFNYFKKQPNSYNGFGLYWTPYFFFDKDQNGKTKTYRNDFLFATYTTITDRKDIGNKLDIFLPISLGYLIHRKGDFLEKNTFGFNAFGVKYGNATLKPFIYFHNFIKGVTPSIQLSIGIGK
ncbi:hypothetical protein GCM10027566_29800 [Arachidicoccus ginsenosidivorans]|uniref:DUF3575 domain-containing protein n=1 Tax=Arachidicoccus ginsenosidivorans TaxID=496057 RepID=A0A5B8VPI7_9BACT|nr:hypothetical protein [Arachidicoccus ginsenosidivorans]QEC72802.1 hypothetical protein FSB73_15065 [Arachidicoccus ginsenosidivorans]